MIGLIRSGGNPEASQVEFIAIRQTGSGRVLIQFGKNSQGKVKIFDTLKSILESNAIVRKLEQKETLEIKDLIASLPQKK